MGFSRAESDMYGVLWVLGGGWGRDGVLRGRSEAARGRTYTIACFWAILLLKEVDGDYRRSHPDFEVALRPPRPLLGKSAPNGCFSRRIRLWALPTPR